MAKRYKDIRPVLMDRIAVVEEDRENLVATYNRELKRLSENEEALRGLLAIEEKRCA